MAFISSIAAWFLKKRYHQMELFMHYPIDVQNELLDSLVQQAIDTEWGKKYHYDKINSLEDYKRYVPISTYEQIESYIQRLKNGEHNLLWPTETRWFAKSSGTTNAKSKYIPVTLDSLKECHYKGGKDMLALYLHRNPEAEFLSGKTLGIAGSARISDSSDYYVGDLSAILVSNLPLWAHFTKSPDLSIGVMEDWTNKVDLIVDSVIEEDIRAVMGVPSWMLLVLNRVLEKTGKSSIHELWPNFELVIHGGVNFEPYQRRFEAIMGKKINYQEVYNASEGFFAIQDSANRNDLLLMLDYGIFYEFMPIEELGKANPITLSLQDVKIDTNYALIITTNAGLWRYLIGDTVVFTSLTPFRIRISGRTKSFINIAGEEIIVENAEFAVNYACQKTNAIVKEYTAGPLLINDSKITHEWLIEFEKEPEDLMFFGELLDNALKIKNSDYEAKRFLNMVLETPLIISVPENTFYNWLKQNGKLGGQYKIPRLSNDRGFIEDIKALLKRDYNDNAIEGIEVVNTSKGIRR